MPFPDFDAWERPWGEDEFDAEKAAKLVYNLHRERDTLKSDLATARAEAGKARQELTTREQQDAEKAREGESEIQKLTRQMEDLQGKLSKAEADRTRTELRAKVAADLKLTPAQAKYLGGEDEESMRVSAQELLEAFPAPKNPAPPKDAADMRKVPAGQDSDGDGDSSNLPPFSAKNLADLMGSGIGS